MKHTLHQFIVLLACLIVGCGTDRLAGGSTSETEANIYGYVRLPNGSNASFTKIKIRPTAYLTGSNEFSNFIYDTITDNLGSFAFPKIARGKYIIEFSNQDSLAMALPIEVNEIQKQNLEVTLKPYATLISTREFTDSSQYTIEVFGLEKSSINQTAATLESKFPNGIFDLRVSANLTNQYSRDYPQFTFSSGTSINLNIQPLPTLDSSLIGSWSFEETDSIIIDSSMSGLNGHLSGAIRSSGKIGKGLQLTYPNAIDLGIPKAGLVDFLPDQDFTLTAWVKISTPTPKMGDAQRIISMQTYLGRTYILRILPDGTAAISVRTALSPKEAYNQKSQKVVSDGQWHHLAGRRQKGWLTVFVDGKADGSSFADSVLRAGDYLPPFTPNHPPVDTLAEKAASQHLYLGGNFVGEQNVEGNIDEVKIYRRALSVAEILKLSLP